MALTHPDQSNTHPNSTRITDVRAFIKLHNQLDISASNISFALQAPNSIIKQGFFSVYASGGSLPPFPPPQVKQNGQFSYTHLPVKSSVPLITGQ